MPNLLASMDEEDDIGQGKLYLPANAIVQQVVKKNQEEEISNPSPSPCPCPRGGIRRNVDKLLEKLSAAAVPADALDNARHFLETVVRVAAHGLTIDAFSRIKSHLSDFLPSLSPPLPLVNKTVEDAEEAAATKVVENEQHKNKLGQQQADHDERVITEDSRSTSGNNNKPAPAPAPPAASSTFMFPTSSLFVSLVKPRSRL